jgi:hypothetical protein
MSIQSLEAVVSEGTLSFDVAERYLTIYLGEADWKDKITSLWNLQKKKHSDIVTAKDMVKKAVACACLIPVLEKASIPEDNHQLLFWVTAWAQFKEKDWFSLFQDVIKNDIIIENNRKKILQMGIFEQIDMSPLTRQAYNWMYDKFDQESFSSEEKKKESLEKIKNMVKIYGGAVICNLFTNHKSHIDKVFNWRTGYFIEKEIHKIYTLEQIARIKTAEINKTNKNYIKNFR